jgi:hypothetical protein
MSNRSCQQEACVCTCVRTCVQVREDLLTLRGAKERPEVRDEGVSHIMK